MSKFSRDFVNGMIEFFKIPEDVGDCENCRVVDWVEANDISGYLSLGNESYLKQVAAFKNGRKFRKKCKTC